MYQTLTTYQAAELLRRDSYTHWSCNGAKALVEYLEREEEYTGESIEFDVVAIRCDYSEYSSAVEAAENYGFLRDADNDDENEEAALRYLQDNTTVIEFEGGVIIQDF